MDIYQVEQRFSAEIRKYAEKAYRADPRLAQSLIAKAMVHVLRREYQEAVPYLEEDLEYYPNSALVINILSDFYTSYLPDSKKYLEYALKGIRLDIASHDSAEVSFIYLHISSAVMQSGFVEEAETYIQKSLDYDPGSIFSMYLNAYIVYARNMDLRETRQLLLDVLERDPGRYDVLQEVGKVCYYMRDFDQAFVYYRRYLDVVESQDLDVYRGEKAKIGLVMERTGHSEMADSLFRAYREYAENDQSIYMHLSLAMYHSHQGDTKKALEELDLFSREKNFHYWIILFLEMDPLVDSIRDLPEFQRIFSQIQFNFWEYHKQIKENLASENLL
jgi:tetratricopeptide (TPR) repeat protein